MFFCRVFFLGADMSNAQSSIWRARWTSVFPSTMLPITLCDGDKNTVEVP